MKTVYTGSLRKFFPFVLLAAMLSVFSFAPRNSHAALAAYKFTYSTGGSLMPSSANMIFQGYQGASNAGLVSTTINLGFNFKFDGNTYTQIRVYVSGLISFGATQITTPGTPNLASTSAPVVAAFWGGISSQSGRQTVRLTGGSTSAASWGGPNCGVLPDVEYQVSGSAPNRVMTVCWNNIDIASNEALSIWQVRLYETSNAVEVYYQNMTTVSCGAGWGGNSFPTNAAIGVANGVNNFISIVPQAGGGAPTSSTATATNNNNIQGGKIQPGTVYTFVQPPNVQLKVVPKTLTFGNATLGSTTSPLCVTVSNVGTDPVAPLIISSATISGTSDFAISSSPAGSTYAVGATGQYCITFRPTLPGLRQGILTIKSNGVDSGIQSIALSGTGLISDIKVDSTTRFKKTRTRLGDSLTQYVHITATGQVPSTFLSFPFTGADAGQYFISHFPQSPLAPGVTDSLGITYVPTIEGKHVATVTINSDAYSAPSIPISLQGTGILPHIVVTPPILLFDSTREGDTICKNIDIWNPGSDTLKILTDIMTSNDGDFHYSGLNDVTRLIPPDNHRTVTVCFAPLQRGDRQARLVLKTNIIKTYDTPRQDTAGTVTIDIRGSGVPFGKLSNTISGTTVRDSAKINSSVCRFDTLSNTGDADILVKSLTLSSGTVFSYSGITLPYLLKARTSVVFTVCAMPDKQGQIDGTITVSGTTSGSNITKVIQVSVFGLKICASGDPLVLFSDKTVTPVATVKVFKGSDSTLCETITNCGDVPASYTASITGTDAAQYSITTLPNPSALVAPGASTTFCIKFSATQIKPTVANLHITAPDITAIDVPMTGEGVCATIGPITASVPETPENEKKTFTITLTNNGTSPWSPGTPVIAGLAAGDYSVISTIPDPILPGGQGIVTIEFHPPVGTKGSTRVANITWPNAGPCQTAVPTVDLSGVVVASSVTSSTEASGFILDQSYPNPTSGKTSFSYFTPSETEISISLLDMTGKFVRTLITGRVSEGPHVVNFDASNLASGTYVYLLQSGNVRLTRQFILTR